MDLFKLKVFFTVAKEGSITKAAKKLHISQPALSRTIQIFEERLKIKLFKRLPRGLQLTLEGARVYDFAKDIMDKANAFERNLHHREEELQGELKLITTPHMASTWLMKYLPGFLKLYPKVILKVIGKQSDIFIEDADVIIRSYIHNQPGLVQRKLKSVRLGLFASEAYLAEYGEPKTPEDLDHHRLITFEDTRSSAYRSSNWILEVGANPQHPRISYFQVNSIEGNINAAEAGLGITELLDDLDSVKNSKLVPVLPQFRSPVLDVCYTYLEENARSRKITILGSYLEDAIKSEDLGP